MIGLQTNKSERMWKLWQLKVVYDKVC